MRFNKLFVALLTLKELIITIITINLQQIYHFENFSNIIILIISFNKFEDCGCYSISSFIFI
jgi:hypothetical protein